MDKERRKIKIMKAKIPSGHMVIFFETDLEKSKPFDESSLTDVQKLVFSQLRPSEQEKVRMGYRTFVQNCDDSLSCSFNEEGYVPPESAIKNLARTLLPKIREFYAKEENQRAYEEWKKQNEEREQKKAKSDMQ